MKYSFKKFVNVYDKMIENISNQCVPNMSTNTLSSKISDHWVDNHYGKKENIYDIEVQHSCNENHFVYWRIHYYK